MTDPLKLAEELEDGDHRDNQCPRCWECCTCCADPRFREVVAAALRLAEAADDNDFPLWPRDLDGEPVRGATLSERMCPYCEETRGDGHARTCPVAAYRAAREGS